MASLALAPRGFGRQKVADLPTTTLVALVAALLSRSVSAVPLLERLRSQHPDLYTAIVAAASAEAAMRVQAARAAVSAPPEAAQAALMPPRPGMLL
jgi:hypothetical protein